MKVVILTEIHANEAALCAVLAVERDAEKVWSEDGAI
jgi:hypothetical protein